MQTRLQLNAFSWYTFFKTHRKINFLAYLFTFPDKEQPFYNFKIDYHNKIYLFFYFALVIQ